MMADEIALEVKMLQRQVDKIERDLREQYGLIKELAGRVSVTAALDNMQDDLGRIQTINIEQSRQIGELAGSVRAVREAMVSSGDSSLRKAAEGIVINNISGDQASVAQGQHVKQGI